MSPQLTDLERHMLSCDTGYTYRDLARQFSPDEGETGLVDKTLQRFRRKGLIAFTREGVRVVWRPTPAGRALLDD